MSKTRITRERSQTLPNRDWGEFTKEEVLSAVCKYFTHGYTPSEIVDLVSESHGVTLSREDPYRLLSYAAQQNWLQFTAPVDYRLADALKSRFPWLEKVVVVRTSVTDDISYHVAALLKEILLETAYPPNQERRFHLGLTGGNSLRKASRHLAAMLRETEPNLPNRIVLHAMVGGFTFHEDFQPSDANSFFTYFSEPHLKVKMSFLGLHAPGMIHTDLIPQLKALPFIKTAFDRLKQLNVVLTSAGGHWRKEHSIMHDMYRQCSRESLDILNRSGVIGDMMWRPINQDGPVEVRTPMRAMTLIELSDLPRLIREGKKVVLHLGPCGNCGGDKREVLRAILRNREPLITHLVADSRSVEALVKA